MRYSQYFVQAATASKTDPAKAENMLREAESHASAYFPDNLILCTKVWKFFLNNSDQAERCLLKAEVHTQDAISFAELTKAWIEILQDKASAERCYKKYVEFAEKENLDAETLTKWETKK